MSNNVLSDELHFIRIDLGKDIREKYRELQDQILNLESYRTRTEYRLDRLEYSEWNALDRLRELNDYRKEMPETMSRMQQKLDTLEESKQELHWQLEEGGMEW